MPVNLGSTKGQNLNTGSTAVFLGSSEDAGKPGRRPKLPNRGTTEQAAVRRADWQCDERARRASPALSENHGSEEPTPPTAQLRRPAPPRLGIVRAPAALRAQRAALPTSSSRDVAVPTTQNGRAPARLRQPAADRQPPADGPQHAPGQPAADGPGQPPGHVQPAAEPRELRGPRGRRGAAAREPRVDGRLAALDAGQRRRYEAEASE